MNQKILLRANAALRAMICAVVGGNLSAELFTSFAETRDSDKRIINVRLVLQSER